MKTKNLLILALLAGVLPFIASCSNDELVAENQSNPDEISFRPLVTGVTRTANSTGLKTSFEAGDLINVYAAYNNTMYFQDDFTKQTGESGPFTSTNKHYWPIDVDSKNITFTAIWGATQTAGTVGNITSYSPDASATNQKDILIARHTSSTKENPVLLNFRHILSQIIVMAKNTNPTLKVTITGVRIGYIKTASTSFTYSGGVTDTKQALTDGNITSGVTLVSQSDWTLTDFAGTTKAKDYKYDQTVTSLALIGNTSDTGHELTGTASWILLPQNMTDADTDSDGTPNYATTKTGTKATPDPDLAGSYLALKMTIENYNGTTATGTIVSEQWCYWPITTNWNPGYKYTYTIDVAGGGYEPEDTDNDGEGDPVLDGVEIIFSPTCSVDEWVPQTVDIP